MLKSTLVLAGFLLIFAYIEHVLDELNGRNDPNKTGKKILILGAGMSGISAAKTLHDHGYTNIQILEGSNRVGGRVKSANLSGYAVELGAQWIYGAGTNPIVKLASKYNLHYKLTPDTWTLRDAFGNDLTEYGDEEYKNLKTALGKFEVFATKMRINGSSDMTAEGLLRFCGWEPNNAVAESVEVFEIDKESGRETPSLTAKYLCYFNVYKQHGDGNFFVVNDTRGYEYIVEKLKEDFLPKDDTRLVFNKKVTQVANWNGNDSKVRVYSDDGSLYEADYVIVTFSLGVLQSRNIIFSPRLPDWKLLAINKFGFGQCILMYLKFNIAFWDNTSWIIQVPNRHGEHCVWLNMNFVFPGCNILQLELTGTEAKAADRLEDSKLIAKAMQVLRAMYPLANIPEPENFTTSRWMSDPFTFGAFSYWLLHVKT